jgi:hypothetical protein
MSLSLCFAGHDISECTYHIILSLMRRTNGYLGPFNYVTIRSNYISSCCSLSCTFHRVADRLQPRKTESKLRKSLFQHGISRIVFLRMQHYISIHKCICSSHPFKSCSIRCDTAAIRDFFYLQSVKSIRQIFFITVYLRICLLTSLFANFDL